MLSVLQLQLTARGRAEIPLSSALVLKIKISRSRGEWVGFVYALGEGGGWECGSISVTLFLQAFYTSFYGDVLKSEFYARWFTEGLRCKKGLT